MKIYVHVVIVTAVPLFARTHERASEYGRSAAAATAAAAADGIITVVSYLYVTDHGRAGGSC